MLYFCEIIGQQFYYNQAHNLNLNLIKMYLLIFLILDYQTVRRGLNLYLLLLSKFTSMSLITFKGYLHMSYVRNRVTKFRKL